MPLKFRAALTGACLAAMAGSAFAQAQQRPAQPQPPAQQAQPQQQQPPSGPMKVELNPTQTEWTKVCGHDNNANKDVCYTTRDFGTQADQPPVLALAIYDIKGDEQKIVRFLMPVGLMLRPGFRFSVDKGATLDGGFEICFPNGCFAEVKVKGPTVEAMKKGQVVNVAVKNQVNNEVTFVVPIAGFGKAFDGPAIDPKVLEEQQKRLQEEMQKKAEDMRRSEAAKTSPVPPTAAPTPAPAAPATPAAPGK
jgi:invasion protein IalB